jgi:hypothetical protein
VLSLEKRRVMTAIESCRTAALGGHVDACDKCGYRAVSYNSCRDRHCPKCQGSARQKWLAERESELLPVPYFHVVFTVPHCLVEIALQNKRVFYGILFHTAAETLLTIARDPKHLGAEIGFLVVLHTWGRNLLHHPHLHCVVPGGGLSSDRKRWIRCKRSKKSNKGFLLPVHVLSGLFRRLFLSQLKKVFDQGELRLLGLLAPLSDPAAFDALLAQARALEWVVYCKHPFGGPRQVLRYLGRYTHRVAISNDRLVAVDQKTVTFRWKDYKDENRHKLMTLDAHEFIRRFLLHVLPGRFVRIRHFGFLGNRQRTKKLALCRQLLAAAASLAPASSGSKPQAPASTVPDTVVPSGSCPACGQGRLRRLPIASVAASEASVSPLTPISAAIVACDSS